MIWKLKEWIQYVVLFVNTDAQNINSILMTNEIYSDYLWDGNQKNQYNMLDYLSM